MKDKIEVIDNFLKEEDFLKVKEYMLSNYFPWFRQEHVVDHLDDDFQFTHVFYNEGKQNSEGYEFIKKILNRINPFLIVRIKANLLTKTKEIIEHKMHADYRGDDRKKITTSIFYINTNNGYTKFKNGKIVKSVENRFVSFNSDEFHTGTTCTDEKNRIVINFNYIL
jgi:hypothetical protein